MGNNIPQPWDVFPKIKASLVSRPMLLSLFTIHNSCRRLDEAKVTYQKVLELDAQHSLALGFLGMVYHLLEDIDQAIIKYHEVCLPLLFRILISKFKSYHRR
jgi:hypothetical protein